MNQEWLIRRVLADGRNVPEHPAEESGCFLSIEEAQEIVENTVDHVGAQSDDVLYTYLRGHRKRLAHSLSLIPKAEQPGARCLDVGGYGYMGFWAKKYLGYDDVVGIEWHPNVDREVIHRKLEIHGEIVEYDSYNFDVAREAWPVEGEFDTALFFEVLEHVNSDPMGVMENIHRRLKMGGRLVMSVPNAISYKGLKEFLSGMPPWTYWFFHPDLEHEPRHCFEYTPTVFQVLLRAAGFEEEAFRTIYAYSEADHEEEILTIAESLAFDRAELGDTMIALVQKASEEVRIRYPDVLYDPDGYYRSTFPAVSQGLHRLYEDLRGRRDELAGSQALLEERERRIGELERQLAAAESRLDEVTLVAHESPRREAAETSGATGGDRSPAELELENNELRAQVEELLFVCDCYLQQINDPAHCSQVVREARLRRVLRRSKSFARKIPVLRTILRPIYRRSKRLIKRYV